MKPRHVRSLVTLSLLSATMPAAHATLLAYDGFAYDPPDPNSLIGLGNISAGFDSLWQNQDTYGDDGVGANVVGGLSYLNFATPLIASQRGAAESRNNYVSASRTFPGVTLNGGPLTTGTYYLSFLMAKGPTASGQNGNDPGNPGYGGLSIYESATGSEIDFLGFGAGGAVQGEPSIDFLPSSSGNASLLVYKLDLDANTFAFYLDPVPGDPEPEPTFSGPTRTHDDTADLNVTLGTLGINADPGIIYDEIRIGTTYGDVTPKLPDGDGDGIADYWEDLHVVVLDKTDPLDAVIDHDSDGLTSFQEYGLNLDPNDSDTDNGLRLDGAEVGGTPATNPKNPDTDGDGLLDGVETNTGIFVSAANTGTDPTLGDTDGDTLSDAMETGTLVFVDGNDTGTNPNSVDTDGDTLPDNWEVANSPAANPLVSDAGADPDLDLLINSAEFTAGTLPADADTDNDGRTDYVELNTPPLTNPTDPDSDDDGLNDGAELALLPAATDPNDSDSDDDSFSDGAEVAGGSDPNSAASTPPYNRVLYYPFDLRDGTIVTNNAPDATQNGTLQGAAAYTVGKFGGAFLGNRTGANDARVTTNREPGELGMNDGYTAMAWVRWDGPDGNEDHMVFGQDIAPGFNPQLHLGIRANNGGVEDIHFGHWTGGDVDNNGGTVNIGEWHHLTWTWSGTQGRVWLDGVEATNLADTDEELGLENMGANVTVGMHSIVDGDGSFQSFNGAIDEVKIFDRPLLTSEILAEMAGPPVLPMTSVAYDTVANQLSFRILSGIPAGQTFHFRSSTDLQTWVPFVSGGNFTIASPQPFVFSSDSDVTPKLFIMPFQGATPAP